MTAVLKPDRALLLEHWRTTVHAGDVYEVRIPNIRRKGPANLWQSQSGYFDNAEAFADTVCRITSLDALAVFMTLNPVPGDLLARRANRLADAGGGETTADADIQRLTRLFADCDPVRDAKISATDDERAAALQMRDRIRDYLTDQGWPNPEQLGESGNGGHAIYAIDLPNDPESVALVQGCLQALAGLFDSPAVKVDQTTYNPARLVKIPGTIAAKGDSIPNRPHRMATATYFETVPVARALLETLAGPVEPEPEPARPKSSYARSGGERSWKIADVLHDAGIGFTTRNATYGTVYALDRCLTSNDHTDGASIIEMKSGALAYRCHHDRCAGKGWAEVKDQLPIPKAEPKSGTGKDYQQAQSGATAHQATAERKKAPVLHEAARYGLTGELVAAFEPNTEADSAAILISFLVAFGNACGSGPHTWVAETRHGLNLAAVTVGATSRSRKGTAWGPIARVFERANSEWLIGRKVSGIGSGEGIIWAIRDPSEPKEDPKTGQTIIEDQGIKDKRLMVHEAEFSSVLKVANRDGSILSEIVRKAWDGETLQNTVKRSPVKATSPHVSFLGHITEEELRRELSETAQVNGLANRFLWVYVRRSKLLPDAPRLDETAAATLGGQVRAALGFARACAEIRRDEQAAELWRQIYADLSKDYPGMFGALTARAEAQVLRLSMVYALLDRSNVVRVEHLTAALALWRYCADSVRFIFGDRAGDPVADRIREALRASGPLTETDIRDLFGRHQKTGRIQTAFETLLAAGMVTVETVTTGGRPARIWKATQ